jgi:hypothetical protein
MSYADTYFDSFSGAVQHARMNVEAQGYVINEDDWFREVTVGNGAPNAGVTTRATVGLSKDGKEVKKALHLTVYNLGVESGRPFELNYYVS